MNFLHFTALLLSFAPLPEFELTPGGANEITIEGATRIERIAPDGTRATLTAGPTFRLGPMAAPPVYDYEAGALWVRGYTLLVTTANGETLRYNQAPARVTPAKHPYPWWHLESLPTRPLRFVKDHPARWPFDLKTAAPGPLSLRVNDKVLEDQDDFEIQVRLNSGAAPFSTLIRITRDNREHWRRELTLQPGAPWTNLPVAMKAMPPGDYTIQATPILKGQSFPDGPTLTYHRRAIPANELRISPIAPWTLERDPTRAPLVIEDFRAATVPTGKYTLRQDAPGRVALIGAGDAEAPPATLRLPLRGHYAVFARAANAIGIHIQISDTGLVRFIRSNWRQRGTYLEAADFTPATTVRIFSNGYPNGALTRLEFIPVTAASTRALDTEIRHPPTPLYAVNDWADNFGTDGTTRIQADQLEAILCTESELGLRHIGWSVGRSWVEYRSALPDAKAFPCVPYDEARRKPGYPADPYDYSGRIAILERFDPLDVVNRARSRCQAEVWPWLAMQRHYGVNFYGGLFACPFYRDNPQWWRFGKDGKHAPGVSYFFPEVRKERVDILLETAARGADGLVVGCDRQVPMLLYDPAMVEAYRAKTGIDARKIDASNVTEYQRWIRWRADFFTQVLRDLKQRLAPLRAQTGRPIPVSVRLPSSGLDFNLAQGLDIEQWCKEGLLSRLQLDPLEELAGHSRHDIRPYLALARRYGIQVIGGVGATAFFGDPEARPAHIVSGLHRALGLLRAGVDGIDTYETNAVALGYEERFIVPLFGNRSRLEMFLKESNLEACFPVEAGNAAAGHDNHSRWDGGWDIYGFKSNAY